jgi:hypothetical protein
MLTTILTYVYNVLITYFNLVAVATVPNCPMHSYESFKNVNFFHRFGSRKFLFKVAVGFRQSRA